MLPVDVMLIPVTFFEESKWRIMQVYFICICRNWTWVPDGNNLQSKYFPSELDSPFVNNVLIIAIKLILIHEKHLQYHYGESKSLQINASKMIIFLFNYKIIWKIVFLISLWIFTWICRLFFTLDSYKLSKFTQNS